MNKKIHNEGFSLIEVIIALGIFTILAVGVISVATNSFGNFYGTGDKQAITQFAQEGIEVARAIRDNSWQDIEDVSGSGTQKISKAAGGYWEFSSGSNTFGSLSRNIVITDVSRNTSEEIVSSGGIDDPNTKKVTVTVSGSGISDYVLSSYLINWSYESWLQTNWSGIGDREFWSDHTMASSSFSGISTSTSGQINLAGDVTGYLYSSIYDLGADDQDLQSVIVEQNIPSGCDLDITVETSDSATFTAAGVSSYLFSSTTATYYTSSTPISLNGKRYMRYKVDMTNCGGSSTSLALYSVKINYR